MDKFGLLGEKLGYSFSKKFFNDFFLKNSIKAKFDNYEIPTIDLISTVFQENLKGLCITMPYKETIIPYLDELSAEAKEIGAVNVVQFKDGQKIGHNTDAFGFHQSIKPFLTSAHQRALIIGTGGASKAVAHVFKIIGIDVLYISRTPKNSNEFNYSDINEHMINACKVIVNCTPVGTYPNIDDCIDFPFHNLTKDHLVIDLIYNPAKTKFLRKALENNATILNGESMLKEQALVAYKIWTKK
jgi:shikimate dehydrogenase